jgi:hypothetical protein
MVESLNNEKKYLMEGQCLASLNVREKKPEKLIFSSF